MILSRTLRTRTALCDSSPGALWSYAPFLSAVKAHALAEITKGGPDRGSGPTDALTNFWPMALRNDKEIMLATLAVSKCQQDMFKLAGEALQADPDVRRAAGVKEDLILKDSRP
jgi:hypothetical protein